MILTRIIFTLVNIVLAFIDAHKIIKSKVINHFLNGAVYLALVAVPVFILKDYWLIPELLLNRLLFFNIPLSKFRGLKWDYVSKDPASITDKAAKAIFGMNGKLMYGFYAVLLIGLIVKSYLWHTEFL